MPRLTRALAYTYIVMCGGLLVIAALLCIGTLLSDESTDATTMLIVGTTVISIVYLIPGLVGGLGLLRGRPWARGVMIIISLFTLFGFPIGTALGAFGLWALLGPGSKRPPDGRPTDPAHTASAPDEEQKRIVGILVAMGAVASLFVVLLGTGFRVTDAPTNPIDDALYYSAIVVLALLIIGVARSGWVGDVMSSLRGGRVGPIDRMRMHEHQRQWHEERRIRLEALAADPTRRKYVALIERGESWSDAHIEYDMDRSKLATCVHLQPIERAMRDAGIDVRLEVWQDDAPRVSAPCRVDPELIREQFAPPPFVEYATPTPVGRAFEEALPAMLRCGQCKSEIRVVHRLDAKPETPIFPAGGSDAPLESDETSARFTELHGRVLELARLIDAPTYYLPTYRVPEGDGRPHVEIDGDTYSYVTSERGVERERHPTRAMDDLLYWVFRDVTFSMAGRIASGQQKPGEDFRRPMFREQLALLRRLDPRWEARAHLDHLEVLTKFPFTDEN